MRLTGDTVLAMGEVSVRELRNAGGWVLDRVLAGEVLVVTRDGKPVAELHALRRPDIEAATLLERWRHLPIVDPAALRSDIDALLNQAL